MQVDVAQEPAVKRPRHADGAEFSQLTLRQCHALLKPVRAHADSHYFMQPVNYELLGIPDYPKIVKNPMDLGTIDDKLSKGEYLSVDAFVADVRLVFYNCRIYNPSNTAVGIAGANVSRVFENALAQAVASAGSAAAAHKSGGTPRVNADPPPPGGGEYGLSMKAAKAIVKSLQQHGYAGAFKQPVDPVRLGIPNYPEIITNPMDLGTVMTKLGDGDYATVADVSASAEERASDPCPAEALDRQPAATAPRPPALLRLHSSRFRRASRATPISVASRRRFPSCALRLPG